MSDDDLDFRSGIVDQIKKSVEQAGNSEAVKIKNVGELVAMFKDL